MSKQELFTMKGHLLTNASRVRTGTPRAKPPIDPQDDLHANDCGCMRCRVTHKIDEAIDRQLSTKSDFGRNGLAPTPGVLGNTRSKGKAGGPLMPTRGVLAGDAS